MQLEGQNESTAPLRESGHGIGSGRQNATGLAAKDHLK